MNIYINYYENFKVGDYLFEDSSNVSFEFLLFLLEIPNHLRNYLINNIVPVGGFCLINKFFLRFKEELEYFVKENEKFSKQFNKSFIENFNFINNKYPSNLINWAGGEFISICFFENVEKQ